MKNCVCTSIINSHYRGASSVNLFIGGKPKRSKLRCSIEEVDEEFWELLRNPDINYELHSIELLWDWEPTCNSSSQIAT